MSTTRFPSHSAQVEETRRSLCDSESGVKKTAVGHHLGEDSHTIERSRNLEVGGSEWVCDQCGVEIWMCDWRGEWVWDQRVGWVFGSGD